jgi:hypothetical protein
MKLSSLKEQIKEEITKSGQFPLVGIGSRERLKDAPPSADMDYCLPGAQSCIIWVHPNPIEALENYFSKRERMSLKKHQQIGYAGSWRMAVEISRLIEENSEYKAFPVIPNAKYRKREELPKKFQGDYRFPDFSLRYGAVAAGLGHLGWSGNLFTKEYGASVYLGGVLTTAALEPDPMLDKNYCNKCKICMKVCSTGYAYENEEESHMPVIIGGYTEKYAKRGTYNSCGIGCAGWTGLSEDGTWSTWTPGHICLKEYPKERWHDRKFRASIAQKVIINESFPQNLKEFNIKIAQSFGNVGKLENVGLRPFEDTNPRCGNCNFVCVADYDKRKELYQLLISSGKVFIDDKGREYVKKLDVNGEEVTYYPPNYEEFFTKEEIKEMDSFRDI